MITKSVLKLFRSSPRNCFTPYEIYFSVDKSRSSISKELISLLNHHYIDKIVIEVDGKALTLYKKDKNTKWEEQENENV